MVIRGLGMERCRDTIVGNHMRRGVSGGSSRGEQGGVLSAVQCSWPLQVLCASQGTGPELCATVQAANLRPRLLLVAARHSGGERKRVSIGHELLINPSILMLDGGWTIAVLV
jgi:ABC-type histidine transport system ATPase subunit